MKSLYDFIVEPLGDAYNNEINVDNKKLVLNTKIESFKFVNRQALVKQIPLAYSTEIKIGDTIILHQNVFRVFYDMKGKKKQSRSFFKDNLYFCSLDQVYLYKNKNGWNSFNDRCFIQPIKNTDSLSTDKEKSLIGILKYGNNSLKRKEINPGDLVGYTPNGEWEFIVDGQRLYCMKSNDIVIKHESKGNEIKHNPSWAHSS
tara:strand:- start:14 stop:619 length:606 start_codon:yes stop_codon:yes gene_type:complete